MSIANIQLILNTFESRQADLTHDLGEIMDNQRSASRNSLDLSKRISEHKQALADQVAEDPNYQDSVDYTVDSNAVNEDYEIQLAEINAWETELDMQKTQKEFELNAVKSSIDSWGEKLKNNIKREFTYGGGGK